MRERERERLGASRISITLVREILSGAQNMQWEYRCGLQEPLWVISRTR